MVKRKRKCPLCGHDKNKALFVQKFANNLVHKITSCQNCGFIFVSNSPDQKYYSMYYKTMSKYEHERDEEIHKIYINIIKRYCKKSVKILDVGCSTGHLLYKLRKKGYKNIFGIDPSPKCKDLALQNFNINIETSDFFSFSSRKKFGLIIFAAVFEHLEQVKKAVDKTSKLLSENGHVFISVPDGGSFNLNFEEPFGEFSIEHINFFSISYLYRLMVNYFPIHVHSDGKVIYSLWKKGNDLNYSIVDYINKSKEKLSNLKKVVDKTPSKIIVWGAGSLTQRLLKTTNIKSKTVRLVDRDKNLIGKKLEGILIISPQQVRNHKEPILISSYRFKEDIVTNIKSMNLKNKIITF